MIGLGGAVASTPECGLEELAPAVAMRRRAGCTGVDGGRAVCLDTAVILRDLYASKDDNGIRILWKEVTVNTC